MQKTNNCIDCNKQIYKGSNRCMSCYQKIRNPINWTFEMRYKASKKKIGENNPNFGKIKETNSNWRGGKLDRSGYISIYCPEHPFNRNGYVAEHRLVVEKKIGRYLTEKEVVHHIDFNKKNNHIDNLMLFTSSGEHMNFHIKLKKFKYMTMPMKRLVEKRWEKF